MLPMRNMVLSKSKPSTSAVKVLRARVVQDVRVALAKVVARRDENLPCTGSQMMSVGCGAVSSTISLIGAACGMAILAGAGDLAEHVFIQCPWCPGPPSALSAGPPPYAMPAQTKPRVLHVVRGGSSLSSVQEWKTCSLTTVHLGWGQEARQRGSHGRPPSPVPSLPSKAPRHRPEPGASSSSVCRSSSRRRVEIVICSMTSGRLEIPPDQKHSDLVDLALDGASDHEFPSCLQPVFNGLGQEFFQ